MVNRAKLTAALWFFLNTANGASTPVPFNATYPSTPTPFKIDLNPDFEAYVRDRVAHNRYPTENLNVPAFVEGPSLANATAVGSYWASSYNWTEQQNTINSLFQQYTITVQTSASNYTDPVPLHFVHHRSDREDAVPLLFIHGFPGSFLEVGPIIDNLTTPLNDTLPAFHVVAPSIPGYAFSPAPAATGFGAIEAAHTFHALMQQLGYGRYVIQGGDLGGFILRYQANLYPGSVISVLDNFWLEPPNSTDVMRHDQNLTTPQENAWFDAIAGFNQVGTHFYSQQIAPLQAAYGLTDSPLGFAMWIYNIMGQSNPAYTWSLDEIVTWTMMYVIPGPYSAMRFYREFRREGTFVGGTTTGHLPYVSVPVGVTKRKFDLGFNVPEDWARRAGNIVFWTVHESGGHFAAYQNGPSLLSDIWSFFANASV